MMQQINPSIQEYAQLMSTVELAVIQHLAIHDPDCFLLYVNNKIKREPESLEMMMKGKLAVFDNNLQWHDLNQCFVPKPEYVQLRRVMAELEKTKRQRMYAQAR